MNGVEFLIGVGLVLGSLHVACLILDGVFSWLGEARLKAANKRYFIKTTQHKDPEVAAWAKAKLVEKYNYYR